MATHSSILAWKISWTEEPGGLQQAVHAFRNTQASLSITSSQNLLKLMTIKSVMPSNHLILSSPSPPAFNLSQHQGLFPMSLLFASGGQSIGASASVLPMNIPNWFPLGWAGWISLLSKRLSRIFSSTFQKHQVFSAQPSLWSNSHICTILLENTIALTIQNFFIKVMSLLFSTLSKFVIVFLQRSYCLLI